MQANREVLHLKILDSGHYVGYPKKDPYNYSVMCKGWNPTEKQLVDYFARAKEADGEWGIYDTGYGSVDSKDKTNKTIKQKYFLNLKSKWLED